MKLFYKKYKKCKQSNKALEDKNRNLQDQIIELMEYRDDYDVLTDGINESILSPIFHRTVGRRPASSYTLNQEAYSFLQTLISNITITINTLKDITTVGVLHKKINELEVENQELRDEIDAIIKRTTIKLGERP